MQKLVLLGARCRFKVETRIQYCTIITSGVAAKVAILLGLIKEQAKKDMLKNRINWDSIESRKEQNDKLAR